MRLKMTEVYRDWINALKDRAGRTRIQMRIDRLAHGNPGHHRTLTDGVSGLKVDVGPGYRVDYTERDGELIVLLAGGDKSSQPRDIKAAIELARNLWESLKCPRHLSRHGRRPRPSATTWPNSSAHPKRWLHISTRG